MIANPTISIKSALISRTNGAPLNLDAHIKQSIEDILTTPKGTRVMRRNYGSNLLALVSLPQTEKTKLAIIAETANAIAAFEPRIKLNKVEVIFNATGGFSLKINYSKISTPTLSQTATIGVN